MLLLTALNLMYWIRGTSQASDIWRVDIDLISSLASDRRFTLPTVSRPTYLVRPAIRMSTHITSGLHKCELSLTSHRPLSKPISLAFLSLALKCGPNLPGKLSANDKWILWTWSRMYNAIPSFGFMFKVDISLHPTMLYECYQTKYGDLKGTQDLLRKAVSHLPVLNVRYSSNHFSLYLWR